MLDRANEARRKAESAELFRQSLKFPHLIQKPKKLKGTKKENNNSAIKESREN
jgi:hypothetical protein